ncbi:MAG: phosphoribosylformylglycinamidine synthase, partial [Dehalococcoidia bacterium]|nr:phosphoribosylformylglycinamidine synthase [Dehalococcoidia bacterium]
CHDCSEGGLAVAAAEMAFSGDLGMTLHLDRVPLGEDIRRNDFILFSESNSRFLVEVRASDKDTFEEIMRGIDFAVVGEANGSSILNIVGLNGQRVVSSSLTNLKDNWQRPLRW